MRSNKKIVVRRSSRTSETEDSVRCTFDLRELENTLPERRIDLKLALSNLGLPKDWRCGRKRYRNGRRCIFHEESKDLREFVRQFLRELQGDEPDEGILDFTGAIFPSMVFYQEETPLTFRKVVSFVGARFGAAYFGQEALVSFVQIEPLPGVKFQKQARFDCATFLHANFDRVTFSEGVSFDGTEFEVGATFDGAQFQKEFEIASFDGTKFGGPAAFQNAVFQGTALFVSTEFQDSASFSGTIFRRVMFSYTAFQKDVSFEATVFQEVDFDPDRIGGKCRFVNSGFLGDSRFKSLETSVSSKIEFVGDIYTQRPDLKGFWQGCSQLQRDKLAKVWGVGLRRLDTAFEEGYLAMDMVSLLETDAKDIRFLNVRWSQKQMLRSFNILKRTAVHDEMLLYEVPMASRNYGAVARLYRELRHNYEQELRYPEAGDFYVGEMEMRRLQISRQHLSAWGWLRRNLLSPIAWYRNLGLYGESYALAALWIIGTILLFAIPPMAFPQFICQSSAPDSLDNPFIRSVLAFFQLRSVSALDHAERILGAFLLGILFITLRRRLERH